MSVNRTVASTRSACSVARAPVTNASVSARIGAGSPAHGKESMPRSSTNLAPGIRSATSRPPSIGTSRSPVRCITSVGTWIADSMPRRSSAPIHREYAASVPGLALCRRSREYQRTVRSSFANGWSELPEPPACVGVRSPEALALGGPHVRRRRLVPPGIVRRFQGLRPRSVQDQGAGLVGVRGREDRCERCAVVAGTEQDRLLRGCRLHHSPDIIDPHLEREEIEVDGPIRETAPSLVEEQQPGKRGEPLQEPGAERVLPLQLEVPYPVVDEDEIDRPVAHDLVSDVDVSAPRESDLRDVHVRSPRGARRRVPSRRSAVSCRTAEVWELYANQHAFDDFWS